MSASGLANPSPSMSNFSLGYEFGKLIISAAGAPCARGRNPPSARPGTGRTLAPARTGRPGRADLRASRLRSIGRKQSHPSTTQRRETAWHRSSSTPKMADPTRTAPGWRTPITCTTMSDPTAAGCRKCWPTAVAGGRCR